MRLIQNVILTVAVVHCNYPEYCSKVDTEARRNQFELERKIPMLSPEAEELDLKLLHVSTLLRHGARTPINRYECWKGYTHKWDCSVEDTIRPAVFRKMTAGQVDEADMLSFRKAYDVNPSANELGGTCGMGHLLEEGLMQHTVIGKLFAHHYQSVDQPLLDDALPHHQLLDLIWFRSSDIQRTLASGSIFLNSFLKSSRLDIQSNDIIVHTMDEPLDDIFPNHRSCPRLTSVKEELMASGTYKELENRYARTRDALSTYVDSSMWPGDFYDCMMTNICTFGDASFNSTFSHLDVPSIVTETSKAVNDYATFEYTAENQIYSKTAVVKFMVAFKSELIKLLVNDISVRLEARQPSLAAKLLSGIVPMRDLHEFYTAILEDKRTRFPFQSRRLVLYSGHDTSILQFLGSLGPSTFLGKWPPYASQVIMEIYRNSHDYYFRIIYNGVAITDRIPECSGQSLPRDICPVSTRVRY